MAIALLTSALLPVDIFIVSFMKNADGNFIIGPTHAKSPEVTVQEGVPQGEVIELTMKSADSKASMAATSPRL